MSDLGTPVTVPVTIQVEPKVWYESKVLWFNALTIIAVVIAFLMQQQAAGTLPFNLSPEWVVFIQAVINLILRFVTSAPVTGSK